MFTHTLYYCNRYHNYSPMQHNYYICTTKVQLNGTIPSHTLFKAQQTQTIESSTIVPFVFFSANSFERTLVADRIWKRWRTAPITRSMWILTFANLRVALTSSAESWSQPLVKTGISRVAPYKAKLSATSNPCLREQHLLVEDV